MEKSNAHVRDVLYCVWPYTGVTTEKDRNANILTWGMQE